MYYLGEKGGKKIFANFINLPGSLPELRLHHTPNGPSYAEYRGSSISRANPGCEPSEADKNYWRTIAGIGKEEEVLCNSSIN